MIWLLCMKSRAFMRESGLREEKHKLKKRQLEVKSSAPEALKQAKVNLKLKEVR